MINQSIAQLCVSTYFQEGRKEWSKLVEPAVAKVTKRISSSEHSYSLGRERVRGRGRERGREGGKKGRQERREVRLREGGKGINSSDRGASWFVMDTHPAAVCTSAAWHLVAENLATSRLMMGLLIL